MTGHRRLVARTGVAVALAAACATLTFPPGSGAAAVRRRPPGRPPAAPRPEPREPHDHTVADYPPLPADPAGDVVELSSGERFRGTLTDPTWTVRGRFGAVDVPAEQVLAVVGPPPPRVLHALLTRSGDVLVGRIDAKSVHLRLDDGRAIELPTSLLNRVSTRLPALPATQPTTNSTTAPSPTAPSTTASGTTAPSLATPSTTAPSPTTAATSLPRFPRIYGLRGDQIAVAAPETIEIRTRYGPMALRPDAVREILFAPGKQAAQQVTLADGSVLTAMVPATSLTLQPRALGGGPLTVQVGDLSKLAFVDPAGPKPTHAAKLDAVNGDALCGVLQSDLTIQTEYGDVKAPAADVVKIAPVPDAPGDVLLTEADGTTLRGAPEEDQITLKLGAGPVVTLPVAAVAGYEKPLPPAAAPPPPAPLTPGKPNPDLDARVQRLVEQLSKDDAAVQAAEKELLTLGPPAAWPLAKLSNQQPPAVRERIARLIAELRQQH